MRHIQRELVRAENLLKEGRALLKSWAKDPEAPGASPGTAATRNTLDGIDWALLAAEEGGVASLEEALKTAASAARRSNGYMEELVAWLKGKLSAEAPEGSPSPKRPRREMASGSTQSPRFSAEQREPDPEPQRGPDFPRAGAGLDDPPLRRPAQVRLLQMLRQLQREHPLPDNRGEGGDATPFQILRAQQIIEGALPFLEQEIATTIAEAHSLLFSWTTSLWGAPIVLVNNSHVGESPNSMAETVPWQPLLHADDQGGTFSDPSDDTQQQEETESLQSHRRCRMHAVMDDAA